MAYRVLIADDSPAMRAFVRRVIELSGFELSACFEAGDGAEALAVLNTKVVLKAIRKKGPRIKL